VVLAALLLWGKLLVVAKTNEKAYRIVGWVEKNMGVIAYPPDIPPDPDALDMMKQTMFQDWWMNAENDDKQIIKKAIKTITNIASVNGPALQLNENEMDFLDNGLYTE